LYIILNKLFKRYDKISNIYLKFIIDNKSVSNFALERKIYFIKNFKNFNDINKKIDLFNPFIYNDKVIIPIGIYYLYYY
jgi:hypothetical protein